MIKIKKQVKKNKVLKRVNIIIFLLILVVMSSLISYAYFTNINKFFDESRKDDENGGLALEREQNDFIENGCGIGTMLDSVTGLCWLKNMNTFGQKNWATALTDCSTLDYAGHTNWELPTSSELFTLIDEIGVSGSTCTTLTSFGFTNCQNTAYWSATEYLPNTADAWYVAFSNGGGGAIVKIDSNFVTCVVRH